MSEKDLIIKCLPQIMEMVMEIKQMTEKQYETFKQEHLEDVGRTCPRALGFIKNIFKVIEYTLTMQYLG